MNTYKNSIRYIKYTTYLSVMIITILTIILCNVNLIQASEKWDRVKGDGEVSIDTQVVHSGADYSIKIENNIYTATEVIKSFDVKPNTYYRASVWAKIDGYELMPGKYESGVSMGPADSYDKSGEFSSSEWVKLIYQFNSGNETRHEIALWNGMHGGDCKGTAYYSDFKLEETNKQDSNEWNVAVVVFKNISAPVVIDGKKTTYKDKLTDADALYLGNMTRNIYRSIPVLSDNLWKIKGIDTYYVNDTVTELGKIYDDNYYLDFKSPSVSKSLDYIMNTAMEESGRRYDMIVAFSPINGKISDKWLGLGGGAYKSARICQLNYKSGSKSYTNDPNNQDYTETAVVHEMLHCIENISKSIDPDNFVEFHANVGDYKNDYNDGTHQMGWGSWGAYHSDYMRCTTPDGRGINKNAFIVSPSNGYTLVYGNPVTYAAEQPKYKDVESLKISNIPAKTYTGKNICPAVTIMDGDYKLVKGTDYSVSYLGNKAPGKACVIITGKGKYAGETAKLFDIKPKTPVLSVTKNSGKYKISWKKVVGAYKVQIYVAKKGSSNFKLAKTVNGNSSSTTVSAAKGDRIKVRTYTRLYPQKLYGNYSKIVTLK